MGMVPNPAGDHIGHGRVPAGPIGGQGCRRTPPDMRDDRATALILMPRTLTPEWCNLSLSCTKTQQYSFVTGGHHDSTHWFDARRTTAEWCIRRGLACTHLCGDARASPQS